VKVARITSPLKNSLGRKNHRGYSENPYERTIMDTEQRKELLDAALRPYLDTIALEREQTKFWYENSIAISKQYNELLERNHELQEENRKLYKKLLGLED